MLSIIHVTNVIEIRRYLTDSHDGAPAKNPAPKAPNGPFGNPGFPPAPGPQSSPFGGAQMPGQQTTPPAQNYVPNYTFCTNCGTKYDQNAGPCPTCGKR